MIWGLDIGDCNNAMRKIASGFVYLWYLIYYWFAKLLGIFARKMSYYESLWLICERKTDARDNGYHFFKYMRENHPEVNCAYIIGRGSADYERVAALGKVIPPGSFTHMLAFACAKVCISTHYMGFAPDFYRFSVLRKYGLVPGRVALIQHGIIANDLRELHYPEAKVDLFVCSAVPEYESIVKNYGHPEGVLQRLGLCRYDRLTEPHNEKRQILIMPTWRYYLRELSDEEFKRSEYFRQYSAILNSERLLRMLDKYDCELAMYVHYELQKFSHLFENNNPRVKIMRFENSDVQELLMESKLLITDYSSVFFDFAYMSKPLAYLWFDEDKFYSTQYERGYFDYRTDGFGPVFADSSAAVDFIIEKISDGAEMDEVYQKRARAFFGDDAADHCQKNYRAIEKICRKR